MADWKDQKVATDAAKARAAVHYPAMAREAARMVADDADDFDNDAYTQADADLDATDDIERSGYSIAWALQDMCLGAVEAPVPCGVYVDDEFHAPDHSSQTLLAVIFNAHGVVCLQALAEMKDRIQRHASTTQAIADRAAELMAENAPADDGLDGGDKPDEPDATERDRWADAACDRYERDMDARHGA